MTFCSVVGTRPNFVKEFLINRQCKLHGVHEVLVHTGQHYDYEMSQVFFDQLELPKPDYFLGVKNADHITFTAEVISRLGELLRRERPDFVLSYGDVNSTLSAAIASVKLGIPFVHVEGGIRTTNLYNPEEINRRVSDVLAEVIYCCTKNDCSNLEKEGYEAHRVVFSGDLMKDTLLCVLSEHNIEVARGDFNVLTLHRQENILDTSRLEEILDGVILSGRRTIFPVHPRTRMQLEDHGLMAKLAKSNVEPIKPMGYVEFLRMAAKADKILTDSGGLRREAYILKKPCIVLIDICWFPEISQAGWKVSAKPDRKNIAKLIKEFDPRGDQPDIFGDGRAHQLILEDLEVRFAS